MDINTIKPGTKIETVNPIDLSVSDAIWAVPIGTEFTFKETFMAPTAYHHMLRCMFSIVDSEGVEHVISTRKFNDCMKFVSGKETKRMNSYVRELDESEGY